VTLRCFTNGPLENKYLIGHVQWIAVIKVNLELSRAVFVNKGIDTQRLLIGKVVHVLHKVFKLGHSVDAE